MDYNLRIPLDKKHLFTEPLDILIAGSREETIIQVENVFQDYIKSEKDIKFYIVGDIVAKDFLSNQFLKQFIKIGCYDGWGYIDMDRAVIFKFIVGDASNTPRSLIAIKVSDGRVNFPPFIKNTAEYTDGAIVAFYARFAKRNGTERQKRVATDIFLLDDKHLPLIARLINADRLSFPQHNDVLEFFLDALTSVQVLDHRDVDLFSSALTNLALDSRVPTQLKTLARVERSKLDPTDAVGANVPCEQPLTNAKTHKSMKQKSMVKSRQNGIVVDDVIQVGLKIERE